MFYFFFCDFHVFIMIIFRWSKKFKNDAKKFIKIYMQVCFFQPLNYDW